MILHNFHQNKVLLQRGTVNQLSTQTILVDENPSIILIDTNITSTTGNITENQSKYMKIKWFTLTRSKSKTKSTYTIYNIYNEDTQIKHIAWSTVWILYNILTRLILYFYYSINLKATINIQSYPMYICLGLLYYKDWNNFRPVLIISTLSTTVLSEMIATYLFCTISQGKIISQKFEMVKNSIILLLYSLIFWNSQNNIICIFWQDLCQNRWHFSFLS